MNQKEQDYQYQMRTEKIDLSPLVDVLKHWKGARDSGKFSEEEINENLRCSADIVKLIKRETGLRLKKSEWA